MRLILMSSLSGGSRAGWKRLMLAPFVALLTGGSLLAATASGPAASAAATPGPQPGVTMSAAAATSAAVYLAYTGTDHQVYLLNAAAPTQAPAALGGQLIGAPALAVVPSGVLSTGQALAVFGRGTDNALWWRHQTATGWTGWQSLGGVITSKPGAVVGGSIQLGQLNVFAAGTGGGLWYRVWGSSGWQSWTALGDEHVLPGTGPAGSPSGEFVTAGANQHVWLFGRTGTENGIIDFGGVTTTNPGIAAVPPYLAIFARGTDGALWYRLSTRPIGATGGWASLGGRLTSGVTATTVPGGKTYVFGLGTDNAIWMRMGVWPTLSAWQRL
jgi:hypothetical protein